MARGRGEGGGRQGKGEGLRLVRSPRHTAAGAATNISRYSRGIERASCCAFTAGSREICSFPLRQFDPTDQIALWAPNARAHATPTAAKPLAQSDEHVDDALPNGHLSSLQAPSPFSHLLPDFFLPLLADDVFMYRDQDSPIASCFSESVLSRWHSSFHVFAC